MRCSLEDLRAEAAWKATARFAEVEHAVWPAPAVTDGATTPFPPQTPGFGVGGWGGGGGEMALSLRPTCDYKISPYLNTKQMLRFLEKTFCLCLSGSVGKLETEGFLSASQE